MTTLNPYLNVKDTAREALEFTRSVLGGEDEAELEGYWDGLAEGGTVTMPVAEPPWGGRFGMLTDRFGIDWMIALNAPEG